jgi:uncharacterized repeat protein (TIGR03806 family)
MSISPPILPWKFPLLIFIAFTLVVAGCGGSSGSDDDPDEPPVNASPQANAGANQNVVEGTEVSLNASASSDSDGSITSYLWVQTNGPDVELLDGQTSLARFIAPAVDTTTSLVFRLTVTDDEGATATDDVVISVRDVDAPLESGLDARPANATCIAPEPPTTSASIELTRVFSDLSFAGAVGLLHEPGNDSRWYVIEKAGRVRVFDNTATPNLRTFINIPDLVDDGPSEAGLLAMAFHPDFASNGQVFLYYTREEGSARSRDTLARFTSTDGGQTLDEDSEEILISIEHPFDNHYGGQLGFDTDGFLYLSLGDGGSGGDPGNRAQNTRNLLGSMVRIDVDDGEPYSIPSDNPFAGNALCLTGSNTADTSCPEIFAWGLRNPWRWSFDRATGDIWLADVGQDRVEEINRIQLGGNYGWRVREGDQCHNPSSNCSTAGLIDPVAVIPQPTAQSITGGFVYRGSNIPALAGQYIVGDFITGGLWTLEADGEGSFSPELLDNTGKNIASFAEDMAGELYLITLNGEIHRLDPVGSTSDNFPRLLSQTGCVDSSNPALPAAGLIPYGVNAPFWSDGAEKQRWLALPDESTITVNDAQDWELPAGSVLMKHFHLDDQLIETRLFMRHDDGNWAGYSYEWNSAGTDATLVQGGKVVNIGGQDWIYPSGAECLQCHTAAAGRSLGVETAQLNGDFTYASTGRTANQLITHEAIGTLAEPLSDQPENLPRLVNPADANASLAERARAYLHTNCAQCHRPDGPTNVNLDLRHTSSFADMAICNQAPQNGNLGIADSQLLAPGAPVRSILLQRMNRRDASGMPPLGSKLVDAEGVALIEAWIESVAECP